MLLNLKLALPEVEGIAWGVKLLVADGTAAGVCLVVIEEVAAAVEDTAAVVAAATFCWAAAFALDATPATC